MTLKREWTGIKLPENGGQPMPPSECKVKIPAGTYEMERIPNPFGNPHPWLVIKGTRTGCSEQFLRDWHSPLWDDHQIVLEEDVT